MWIINPRETGKILQHVLHYGKLPAMKLQPAARRAHSRPADPALIAPGVVPGTEASKPDQGVGSGEPRHLGRDRSISGELGKLCVYTGNVV